MLIDCDSHLFEPGDVWARYADPADRDVALRMTTDELGYSWLMWGDQKVTLAEPHIPGKVDGIGQYRQRMLQGLPSTLNYPEFAAPYSEPDVILRHLDDVGFDAAVLFPNYGITWERTLAHDLRATLANMTAWNRWIADVAAAGGGRLHPVAHVSLRDLDWLDSQLTALSSAGVRMALMAPALVAGRCRTRPLPAPGPRSSTTASRPCSTSPTNPDRSTTRGTARICWVVSTRSAPSSSGRRRRSPSPT